MVSGNVLLMTKEDATANIVSSSLKSSPDVALAGVCRDIPELRACLSNTPNTQAVVADIDPDPLQVLYDLSVITTTNPETRVVVISSVFNEKLILEAMQAGARHFLRKESITSEIDEVLERLLCCEAKKEVKLGNIISVFSSSGGCGATSAAVNLANELRLMSSGPVLVIDLDNCYGTVSAYLGITGQYGIAHVLSHKHPINKHLIESVAYNYMEDFHVLLNPAAIEDGEFKSLQYENLTAALQACRETCRYIVVDAPRVAESVATNLASVSKFALIVFQLTVKDLRFARAMMSSFTQSGTSPKRIIPPANRVKRIGPLVRLEDSKEAMGLDSLHQIRSDWRKAMKSINRGQPLAQVARRSGIRRDFRKLAAKIYACNKNGERNGEGNKSV